MRRVVRFVPLGLLIAILLFYRSPFVEAQAPAGFTKIATVTGALTYTDAAVTPGQVWSYVVTAQNLAGESPASNVVGAVTPSTAADPTDCGTGNAHCNILTWQGTSPPAPQFNVYRMAVVIPPAPGSLGVSSH